MFYAALLLVLSLVSPAFAQPTAVSLAEYQRLSTEMQTLVAKSRWDGVEAAYSACVATGAHLDFDDHVAGAHAASGRGDVTTARDRLMLATSMKEDRTVIEWLWTLDTTYGAVDLVAEPGTGVLSIERMPFNPQDAQAYEYAARALIETGSFSGLLPAGNYRVGQVEFEVVAGDPVVAVDLRSGGTERKGVFKRIF